MVHNPKHKVHSFRGLLGDGGQDEINLERQNANVAYRIVKFQVIASTTFQDQESLATIWREEQTSVPTSTPIIDFRDPDVLGVGMWKSAATGSVLFNASIIFDNILFSRNIYVTHTEHSGTQDLNYYIELEEVPVSASALMQLKLGVARKLNLEQ